MAQKSIKTIADIARVAGVDKSTVSRALNDSPLLSAETKERIQLIARKHKFHMNMAARRLSTRESRTIAFVSRGHYESFSFGDLFTLEIISSVIRTLAEKRYDLLMVQVGASDSRDWPTEYLKTGRADGFIVDTSSSQKNTHIEQLLAAKAPFIVWGAPLTGQRYCSVTGDNFSGGRLAAEHLIRTGRRKIAFLGGPQVEQEVQGRYDGFVSGLQQAGQRVDPKRVIYGDYSTASGGEMMRALLAKTPDLDAVFVCSDLMAMAAINTIRDSGRQVPEDVAVIGYDNLPIAEMSNPPLTTISQDLPTAGKLLAENLLQYMKTDEVTNVVFPVELVVRKSA
jgi:DNA-binding LacI/PurR family transcriptional regulator